MKKFRDSITNHITAIAGLILVSLATIGFSSWSLGGGVTGDNGNLNIQIGSYGDFKDCIFLDDSKDNGGVQPLLYSDVGFVDSDGLSNGNSVGVMSINIKVKLKEAQAKVSTDDVYFVSNLTLEGENFYGGNFELKTSTLKVGNATYDPNYAMSSHNNTLTGMNSFPSFKNITNATNILEATLIYNFKMGSGRFQNFYKYAINSNSRMSLYITLGEKKNA